MIETGRLVLRGWIDADKAPLHAMCNDLAVMEYLGAPLMERLGMRRHPDPDFDLDQPGLEERLRPHITYSIERPS